MSTVKSLPGLGARLLGERRGRTALTTAGVALGVALFTGCLITTMTASRGLDDFAAEVNGSADIVATAPGGSLASIVSPSGGELSADVVPALAALPSVSSVAPMFTTATAFEGLRGRTEQRANFRAAATLVGADLDAAADIYPVKLADGRLASPGADELVVPAKVADRLGARVGGSVTVSTPAGPVPLGVVGVLDARGVGRFDRIGFTSLETARRLAGHPDAVSQVAIRLDEGTDVGRWLDQHRPDAPVGVTFTAAGSTLRNLKSQVGALTGALLVLGAGLLFISGFLIYLTLAMSVVERTRLYGILHALGANRRQVRRTVLAEAFVVGAIGTTIGLIAGVAVAAGLRAVTGRILTLFGSPPLVVSPVALLVAFAVGMTVTLVSAMLPARRAAAIDPIEAIRVNAGDEAAKTAPRLVSAVLFVVAAAALALRQANLVAIGTVIIVICSVRLVPYAIRPLARLVGPAVAKLSRGGGPIAVQHLSAERTRSAYTMALIMLVMALAVSISAVYTSFASSLDRQMTEQFGDDLELTAASTFEASFVQSLAQVPGVAAATEMSSVAASIVIDGKAEDVLVSVIDPGTYFDVGNLSFTEGDAASTVQQLTKGPSVVLPEGIADRVGVSAGDTVTFNTLKGPVVFDVAARANNSTIPPTIVTSREAAAQFFGVTGTDTIRVRLDRNASPEDVKAKIEAALANQATFIVTTGSELKRDVQAQIQGGISGFFVLLLLAGIVGAFGLANTMAVSVTKRYREIGVLRALGARRRQIRAMVVVEALTLVVVALVLALPLGMLLSGPLLDATTGQLAGVTVNYRIPWAIVPILAIAGAIVAVASAVWPARRATHLDIDSALRLE